MLTFSIKNKGIFPIISNNKQKWQINKKLIPFILRWEGGFANDPADRGGATMKGITIGTFTTYRKSKGKPTPTVTDLKNISDQEWGDVFKKSILG